ncbi:hypothetical protein BC828DRAFT_772 [Blastocladiella britannica]|nr:hypothetical protein BC828DRAFT_772 [Blastocladiella britannica]
MDRDKGKKRDTISFFSSRPLFPSRRSLLIFAFAYSVAGWLHMNWRPFPSLLFIFILLLLSLSPSFFSFSFLPLLGFGLSFFLIDFVHVKFVVTELNSRISCHSVFLVSLDPRPFERARSH